MPRYVKYVNRKVMNPATGDILTDLDMQLKDGRVIQIASGTRWDGLAVQLTKSAYVSGQPAVAYVPAMPAGMAVMYARMGHRILTDLDDLVRYRDRAS
jgi:hypothetical protein